MKPRPSVVALSAFALAALVAGALVARHHKLRPAREVDAASTALAAARAIGERFEAEAPPRSFESDVQMALQARLEKGPEGGALDEAGVVAIDPKQSPITWRVGDAALIGKVASVLRGEKLNHGDEALRLGLESAFHGGRATYSRAWGAGLEGEVARARVLVAWRRDEQVLVLIASVRRPVE